MPFLFIGLPLLAVAVLNLYTWKDRRFALWTATGASIAQMIFALGDLARCLIRDQTMESAFFGSLSIDAFGAIVLFTIGMIACVTLLVAETTVKHSRFNFGSAVLLLVMGMNGVVMVRDLFSLYVFIEVTSTSSFLLIAINKKREELEGAFKYYVMSALATAMMLLALVIFFFLTGSTSYGAISSYIMSTAGAIPWLMQLGMLLFTVALLIKSGAVPFHTWVPDAHSSAPSPVSILLAGIVIKISGVYALMRVFWDVFLAYPPLGQVLMLLGLGSIFLGALAALGQRDIKRMLAFSSVSQIGYIVLGLSASSALGFVGAALHFFNHASFKSLLFTNAAVLLKQTGSRNMEDLGGLGRKMPVTSVSSVVGLLSMAGIPPLSGFWSKLLILLALWRVSPWIAFAALMGSLLTLSYFLIFQREIFFGKTKPALENLEECRGSLRFVEIALSAVNILAGLGIPLLLMYLHKLALI